MKVLFVCSGNSDIFSITPFIKNQADSLIDQGLEVDFFQIGAKGFGGYLSYVKKLKNYLRTHKFDLIHAHYSFSGWVAVLARPDCPVVLSLMGSDTYGSTEKSVQKRLKNLFVVFQARVIQLFCKRIIVKSENLHRYVWQKHKTAIIPNGVNLEVFKPIDQGEAKQELGLYVSRDYLLFVGDPNDSRKNYQGASEAVNLYNKSSERSYQLLSPFPVENKRLPLYYSACEALVFPSKAEGSPNVVKEAMACNMKIVSTDVGDVKWLFGDTPGLMISSFDPMDISSCLKLVITNNKREGRSRIQTLGLSSELIAEKLIGIYNNLFS